MVHILVVSALTSYISHLIGNQPYCLNLPLQGSSGLSSEEGTAPQHWVVHMDFAGKQTSTFEGTM